MQNTVRAVAWAVNDPPRMLARFCADVRRALNQDYRERWEVTTALTATATVLWQDTMPSRSGWSVDISVIGIASDGSFAAYRRMCRFSRVGTAAPTLLSSDTIGTDFEDVAGWGVAVDVTSNDARLRVTGDAARTVHWQAVVGVAEAKY